MKIKAKRKELANAVKTAAAYAPTRTILPILGNALFEAGEDGKISITCTDLVQKITVIEDAEIESAGKTTIPAKKLLSVLDALSGEDVELETDENYHTTITCGRSKIKLVGMDPKDFPETQNVAEEHILSIDAADMNRMIRNVQYAISSDDARKVLTGMNLEVAGSRIVAVGTDGKRCAVSQADFTVPFEKDFSRIIPANSLRFFQSVKTGKIDMVFDSETQLSAVAGNVAFRTKLIDGRYPQYQNVIPNAFMHTAEINSAEFLAKINLMGMVSAVTKLVFKDGALGFRSESTVDGSVDDAMDIVLKTDEETEMSFATPFLAEAVNSSGAEKFYFRFNGGKSPVKFDFGDGSFCVIMPMIKR